LASYASDHQLLRLTAIEVEDGKPLPREFRIFRAGENYSDRGPKPFVFDERSAAAIMGAYQAAGNLQMMDLQHGATDAEAQVIRTDAADAMCWYALEMRGGELWGVNADWSTEGERRLRAKLQRFVSPTFRTDKSGRIVELANVALVSRAGFFCATDLAALKARSRSPEIAMAAKILKAALVAACSKPRKLKRKV
jgi:phage I-like protein